MQNGASGDEPLPPAELRPWTFGRVPRLVRAVLQRLVLFPLMALVTPITVMHRNRLNGLTGPVIVVANHVSHLDTPVVLRAVPGSIRSKLVVAAAKDYFYSGRFRGALVSLALATIPFDRGERSGESLAECVSLLHGGWSLVLFPEGTRSRTGDLGRVRRGAAVMACSTGVPVLPVYIHGLSRVMPKGSRAPLPGGVVVAIGELVPAGSDVDGMRDRIDAALHELETEVPAWGITDRVPGE